MPQGESIQDFCLKNKIPYNLFHKWYKDTEHQIVPGQIEEQSEMDTESSKEVSSSPTPERKENTESCPVRMMIDIHKWNTDTATKLDLPELEKSDRETGGTMLNVTGMNRFYYLSNFHDMRCKYERVLSIIHQQLNRKPQEDKVFIIMSKLSMFL